MIQRQANVSGLKSVVHIFNPMAQSSTSTKRQGNSMYSLMLPQEAMDGRLPAGTLILILLIYWMVTGRMRSVAIGMYRKWSLILYLLVGSVALYVWVWSVYQTLKATAKVLSLNPI
jgi:hypothetical protein